MTGCCGSCREGRDPCQAPGVCFTRPSVIRTRRAGWLRRLWRHDAYLALWAIIALAWLVALAILFVECRLAR